MNIRAKFKCNSMKAYIGGIYNDDGKYTSGMLYEYDFSPVAGDTAENKKFYASTPSGTFHLNAVRSDLFEIGKEYYLDFSLA